MITELISLVYFYFIQDSSSVWILWNEIEKKISLTWRKILWDELKFLITGLLEILFSKFLGNSQFSEMLKISLKFPKC